MGWGTTFNPEIYLSRLSIKNKEDLKALIEEKEEMINSCEKDLYIYASINPKNFPDDAHEGDVPFAIKQRVGETLESYKKEIEILVKLEILLDHMEEGGKIVAND